MSLQILLSEKAREILIESHNIDIDKFEFQSTRKEFEGDITLVVFPLLKNLKMNPMQLGEFMGNKLKSELDEVVDFNVVKGFLNLVVNDSVYLRDFHDNIEDSNYGIQPQNKEAIMVEYSSPNTNKPLHLGHVRNILLGYSVSEILKAAGKKVKKVQIINDRGIHICKSMIAWLEFGNGFGL